MLALAERWWVPTVRGAAAIAFGVLAILWPGLVFATMVVLFGIFALTDGIVAMVGLWRSRGGRVVSSGPARAEGIPWALQLVVGIAGILAGIATFATPALTGLVLLSFIGAYALVVGVAHVVSAVAQRQQPGAVALGIAGAIAALFGLGVLVNPGVGVVGIAWVIGTVAITAGVALVAMGLQLRRLGESGARLYATMVPEAERVKSKIER